ncbi:HAD-IA family hydrolase [Pendulispora rubella]|uniref:HAD-IA family hydrolase n=1 Tax=Pendulispora rubella TaxID=2741070 RepID=A0ABZ2KPN5_9BACT
MAHIAPVYDTLIIDIGDVLFTWSAETKTAISPRTLRKILNTATWFEYEKGQRSEVDCYSTIGRELDLSPDDIAAALRGARDSLMARTEMVTLLRELKPGRRVYAMSNISEPDAIVLRNKLLDWDVFDRVFTSAAAGARKPNIDFYQYVLEQTGADPRRTIFVDDRLDNLVTARSFGMRGVAYDHFANVERTLRNLCGDPVERGEAFLHAHAKNHLSYTSTHQTINENFTQLLLLEATGDPSLVDYTEYEGPFNFFREAEQSAEFPCDVDTTSVGLTVSERIAPSIKDGVMDEILRLRSSDRIVPVYFDRRRSRLDPVVCTNALTLFYANERGHELAETLDWVHRVLQYRAYIEGTRYYESPEAFLFFISRLLDVAPELRSRLGPLLAARVRERLGARGDALALAMRLIVCAKLNIEASVDVRTLLDLQEVDGAWSGWFYKFGSSGVLSGNRGLTTALAVKAIEGQRRLRNAIARPTADSMEIARPQRRDGVIEKRASRRPCAGLGTSATKKPSASCDKETGIAFSRADQPTG